MNVLLSPEDADLPIPEINGDGYAGKLHLKVAERMGLSGPVIDHKNRNKLDNRRENLRSATKSQNKGNTGPDRRNKGTYKGVTKTPNGRYKACIAGESLGTYDTPEEAARIWNNAARARYGDCTYQNPI